MIPDVYYLFLYQSQIDNFVAATGQGDVVKLTQLFEHNTQLIHERNSMGVTSLFKESLEMFLEGFAIWILHR